MRKREWARVGEGRSVTGTGVTNRVDSCVDLYKGGQTLPCLASWLCGDQLFLFAVHDTTSTISLCAYWLVPSRFEWSGYFEIYKRQLCLYTYGSIAVLHCSNEKSDCRRNESCPITNDLRVHYYSNSIVRTEDILPDY